MGNREALLEGALECLLEKGYGRTTARDITARSGTSLAAIGYHFRSTEQLLNEAIAEGFRRWRGRLTLVLEANLGRKPEDLLAAIGHELTRLFADERKLFIVFLEAMTLSERNAEVRAQAASGYEEDRVGVAALVGAMRGTTLDDERTTASMLLAVVDGLFIQTVISGADAPTPSDVLNLLAPVILARPTDRALPSRRRKSPTVAREGRR
jgi:AcrR family transcriptional regulator